MISRCTAQNGRETDACSELTEIRGCINHTDKPGISPIRRCDTKDSRKGQVLQEMKDMKAGEVVSCHDPSCQDQLLFLRRERTAPFDPV